MSDWDDYVEPGTALAAWDGHAMVVLPAGVDEPAIKPFDQYTPNEQANILATGDGDGPVPAGRVVLVEGVRPWGNRYVGPEAQAHDATRHAGHGPSVAGAVDYRGRFLGVGRDLSHLRHLAPEEFRAALAALNAGAPDWRRWADEHTQGTAWVGAYADDRAQPCPVCRDAAGRPGSALYCDCCGGSGKDRPLLAELIGALGREIDREARGLHTDPDSGLVVPIAAEAETDGAAA